MGWCLAAYQRAVRFAQEDKDNISWAGSIMQLLWHFLVTGKYQLMYLVRAEICREISIEIVSNLSIFRKIYMGK